MGSVQAPPSKSYTHRALLLGLLCGKSLVRNPLWSDDTTATRDAVHAFGGRTEPTKTGVRVLSQRLVVPERVVDVLNSGTTLRLVSGIAALLPGSTVLTGDESIRRRPMQPLLDALRALGCRAESTRDNGLAPVLIRGPMRGGKCALPGDVSSQFVSSLLLACPVAPEETTLHLQGPLKSRPYVDITLQMLPAYGVHVEEYPTGFAIPGGQQYRPADHVVPGDFSSAAFPLVGAVVTGGRVRVTGLDHRSAQGDKAILHVLQQFGARVSSGEGFAEAAASGELRGASVDVGDTPDLFPVLCALGAVAKGKTVLSGAAHLKFKETDRIGAMVANLRKMGARVSPREDGAAIEGGKPLRGARVETHGDHRILMACAIAGLAASRETRIEDDTSFAVSYPRFVEHLKKLGGRVVKR